MVKIILVCGCSGSGKTYITSLLQNKIQDSSIITIDDYYFPPRDLSFKERSRLNFDDPSLIDWKLFEQHIFSIKNGEEISKPIYSFKQHKRIGEEKFNSKKILFIEGIFSFFNKKVKEFADLKIYINTPEDICFINRLQRDIKERKRNVSSIIDQYLMQVKPMANENITLFKKEADFIIENNYNKNLDKELLEILHQIK